MISTFLEAIKSFLKICMPLLGIYVLFLLETSLSIVDPFYNNGVNSLNNTNATHRRNHKPIMDKNIINITNDSIKKIIKIGGRLLEHDEKVSRRIVNKHKGEIHFYMQLVRNLICGFIRISKSNYTKIHLFQVTLLKP